jgi:hypothetical protein
MSYQTNALPMILNQWRERPCGMPRRLPGDSFEQKLMFII